MKAALFLSALAAGAFVASTALFAQTFANPQYPYLTDSRNRVDQDKYPLQPNLGDRGAQPQCGFAATEDWGPNGFQWCDSKNMYPKPQIDRSNAFGLFIPSDRAGSPGTQSGRRGASKFKFHADKMASGSPTAGNRRP